MLYGRQSVRALSALENVLLERVTHCVGQACDDEPFGSGDRPLVVVVVVVLLLLLFNIRVFLRATQWLWWWWWF